MEAILREDEGAGQLLRSTLQGSASASRHAWHLEAVSQAEQGYGAVAAAAAAGMRNHGNATAMERDLLKATDDDDEGSGTRWMDGTRWMESCIQTPGPDMRNKDEFDWKWT